MKKHETESQSVHRCREEPDNQKDSARAKATRA